ncbi:MAG: fructosamine kinase, partial [Alphaproteobacteria bacterium]|nr:fructosamine kinase [Alphaproteobacteria bacterium]
MVSDRLPAGLAAAIAQAIRRAPTRITPLGGGCVSHVSKVEFDGHPPLVIKTAAPAAALALEADMLRHLAGHSQLPVPDVVQVDERFLLTSFIDTAGRLDTAAEHEAATLIAALHKVEGPAFGFAYDTLIGGLHQTNLWTPSWREFFQDHRLLYMASQAHDAEWLPNLVLDRINRLAGRIERWI